MPDPFRRYNISPLPSLYSAGPIQEVQYQSLNLPVQCRTHSGGTVSVPYPPCTMQDPFRRYSIFIPPIQYRAHSGGTVSVSKPPCTVQGPFRRYSISPLPSLYSAGPIQEVQYQSLTLPVQCRTYSGDTLFLPCIVVCLHHGPVSVNVPFLIVQYSIRLRNRKQVFKLTPFRCGKINELKYNNSKQNLLASVIYHCLDLYCY